MIYAKKDGTCEVTGRASYRSKEICEQAMKNMVVDPTYTAYQCEHCHKWHFGKPRPIKSQEPSEPTWNEIMGVISTSPESEIDKAIKLLIDNGYLVLTPEGKKYFKQVISDANGLAKKLRNENDNK